MNSGLENPQAVDAIRPELRAHGSAPAGVYLAAFLVLLLLAVLNSLVLNSGDGIIDDAYIFFRYVDNLLAGHGLTWNPGEVGHDRVEGYTSFLYTMLLTVPRALGAAPVPSAHWINIGLFVGVVVLGHWMMARTFPGRRWSTLVTPLLLATSAALGQASRSGLEQMLLAFTMLLALGLHLGTRKRPRSHLLGGAAFGLVVLARPEGLLFYGICACVSAWEQRQSGLRHILIQECQRGLGVALVVLPHLAWRLWYYGEPLPNTYYAKVGYSLANVQRGLQGGLYFLATFRGALAALALVAWAVAPATRAGRLCASLLLGWLVYATCFLGLFDWTMPYTTPIDWFALLTLGCSVTSLLRQKGIGERLPLALAGLLLVAANAASGLTRRIESDLPWTLALTEPTHESMIGGFIAIGEALGKMASPGDTVAVGACGAIPYLSGLITYDTLGLNDKHIARRKPKAPGRAPFGHEKGDGAYIGAKRPTYLIPLPTLTPEPSAGYVEFSVTFSELTAMPEYRSQYEFKYVPVDGGGYFNYFQLMRTE